VSVVFSLTGCVNKSTAFSDTDSISYESTRSSKNIGYVDYQSSDLLNHITYPVIVTASYTGNKGPYDIRKIQITNVQPKNGYIRIYLPDFKDERFDQIDLVVDYGTVRLLGASPNTESSFWKRLDRGLPTELSDKENKITITSEITAPGSYSASMLKRIIK
jgi:hypothetical protein